MDTSRASEIPDYVIADVKPRPLGSLIASAKRLTSKTVGRAGGSGSKAGSDGWQEDAWDMFDLVGEERFLSTTLANRIGQARLFVGLVPPDQTEDITPVDDPRFTQVLAAFGNSPSGRAQILARLGVNLFIAGDGWLVGIPSRLLPGNETEEIDPFDPLAVPEDNLLDPEDLEWHMMSVTEVKVDQSGMATLMLGDSKNEQITASVDDVWMIRVWKPHPRRWWQADSPTRASLPVLRELVGLTMHVSAQVDSRLAGAGILFIPESMSRAFKVAAGLPPDSTEDPFTDALIEAMVTPISDRASASAVVPLVVTVPDEAMANPYQYLAMAKPLDTEAKGLREEAIRRLALGQDAPPEVLLGTSGMNHWGAWLVREDTVTTHIEPPLALICDALTVQYLWPVLEEQGMAREQVERYVIWYDVSHMIMRPNKADDAKDLYDRKELSGASLRDATGFDDSDAPEVEADLDPAVKVALDLVTAAPSLAADPGIANLVEQIRAVLSGEPIPAAPAPAETPAPVDTAPAADTEAPPEQPADGGVPAEQPAIVASGLGSEVIPGFPYLRRPGPR